MDTQALLTQAVEMARKLKLRPAVWLWQQGHKWVAGVLDASPPLTSWKPQPTPDMALCDLLARMYARCRECDECDL